MINLKLPDVAARQGAVHALSLKWVGMEKIALPILISSEQNTAPITANALADVFVSLSEPSAKGIHMSRLYLLLREKLAHMPLNMDTLRLLLEELVASQQGLSHAARIFLQFDLVIEKPAMLSNEFGFQSYAVALNCEYIEGEIDVELSLTIPYSSTCPCSAALSRQALSDKIGQEFDHDIIEKQDLQAWIQSAQGSVATPHSQRSFAYIKVKLKNSELPIIPTLILEFEQLIGTPVQTAVKREDEQAFAKLNAENLMFCEDAARRLKQALEQNEQYIDYWFKVEHQESLHAHNAVVIDQKF